MPGAAGLSPEACGRRAAAAGGGWGTVGTWGGRGFEQPDGATHLRPYASPQGYRGGAPGGLGCYTAASDGPGPQHAATRISHGAGAARSGLSSGLWRGAPAAAAREGCWLMQGEQGLSLPGWVGLEDGATGPLYSGVSLVLGRGTRRWWWIRAFFIFLAGRRYCS